MSVSVWVSVYARFTPKSGAHHIEMFVVFFGVYSEKEIL